MSTEHGRRLIAAINNLTEQQAKAALCFFAGHCPEKLEYALRMNGAEVEHETAGADRPRCRAPKTKKEENRWHS